MQRKQILMLAGISLLLMLASFAERPVVSYLSGGRFWSLHAWFDGLPGKWKVIAILMMPVAVLALAGVVKSIEVRRARSWIGVPGKIVSAKSVQRKVARSLSSTNDEDFEMRNFAEIVYAYEAGGRKLRGSRLSIGADMGNFEVAEKLARYKTGMPVTVYYDPGQPENAVIERDVPEGMFRFGVGMVAGLTALVFALVFGADLVRQGLRGQLLEPRNASIVTALGLFSAGIALFGLALKRQAAAADGWKETKGRVVASEMEKFTAGAERMTSPRRILLRQRVIYAYRVAGVDYSSDRVSFGARTSSSIAGLEQALVRRYPLGAQVTVYFDPADPSQAVLERGVRLIWLVWATAALFAGMAVVLSGVLG